MEKFDIICRTCNTEKSKLIDLSSSAPANPDLSLSDILFAVCPSVSLQNTDRLPQNICYFCSKQMEIAYKFQLQCSRSQDELLQIIEDATLKHEKPQSLTSIKNEGEESQESAESKSYSSIDEEFEKNLTTLNENLEFLDEDEYMEDNDEGENLTEQITEIEDQSLEAITVLPYAETEAPIMCFHCDKKFFTENGLRFHEKLTHKNLQPILTNAEILTIECKYCMQVFETKIDLITHCRHEHKNELANDFTCDTCQKTFMDKNRYEHHLLYHRKERYQCTVKNCSRNFVIKYKLTDHLKRFHGVSLTPSQTRAMKPRVIEKSL